MQKYLEGPQNNQNKRPTINDLNNVTNRSKKSNILPPIISQNFPPVPLFNIDKNNNATSQRNLPQISLKPKDNNLSSNRTENMLNKNVMNSSINELKSTVSNRNMISVR